jgi:hypothetical protein
MLTRFGGDVRPGDTLLGQWQLAHAHVRVERAVCCD